MSDASVDWSSVATTREEARRHVRDTDGCGCEGGARECQNRRWRRCRCRCHSERYLLLTAEELDGRRAHR